VIYVHIPFCKSFCTYCGFYSEVSPSDWDACIANICQEALQRRDEILPTLGVDTLYIGGGTPSVLPLSLIEKVVSSVRKSSGRDSFGEFTVEVNPDDVTREYAQGLRDLGVNRVSMGVQSFDDGILRWMRRRHDSKGALTAYEILRSSGFENISIDLIFGIDGLSDEVWKDTLSRAVSIFPEHISSYQLSIDPESDLFHMVACGKYREASDEKCRRQYDMLCEALSKAGYDHYEISSFAREGFRSRHNSAYWDRSAYVGLGPAAHSFDGRRHRSWNSDSVPSYERCGETLSDEDILCEKIMLGLRRKEGVESSLLDDSAVGPLLRSGALAKGNGRAWIPEDHFFVCDDIIRDLV